MGRERDLERIANHYGYEAQSRQLIEEMAELTVAINKFWRLGTADYVFRKPEYEMNIFEEIADVEIMLEQMKYLLNCSNHVEMVKDTKVRRQLERMGGIQQ